jgi:hypothetical protein
LFAVATGGAQDSPSLGDLARQQRQKKEQPKNASGKDAKSSKVITNEAIAGPQQELPRRWRSLATGRSRLLPRAVQNRHPKT